MTESPDTAPDDAEDAMAIEPRSEPRRQIPSRPTVDQMSEWSFPASDPPATWTWEVEKRSDD